MRIIKVGDTVLWKGGFGSQAPQSAVIKNLEVAQYPYQKEGGKSVYQVSEDLIRKGYVIFDLNNGHWAYSDQIELI